jgi:hypothetical protein
MIKTGELRAMMMRPTDAVHRRDASSMTLFDLEPGRAIQNKR